MREREAKKGLEYRRKHHAETEDNKKKKKEGRLCMHVDGTVFCRGRVSENRERRESIRKLENSDMV